MSQVSHITEAAATRHDWSQEEVLALFSQPFSDLMHRAQTVHRQHFVANEVQLSTLLSIKTGGCPEDCAYCPQSVRFQTGVENEPIMDCDAVREAAARARDAGATRFCMGAAWRSPKDRDMPALTTLIREVRDMGLETCMTLGMLSEGQASQLAEAGLDYYNHNLDTSKEHYQDIITTRSYADRLTTLGHVRNAGMKVCCGGIVGLGETREDRAELLRTLANLPQHPESVPINELVAVPGTPLEGADPVDPFEFVRCIAVARILMPKAHVRLSAGRTAMSDELQSLCFLAGANSIFYGEKLLTTGNPDTGHDQRLFERLGIVPEPAAACEARRKTA